MEAPPPPPNANGFDEFLQTGRTGRRNAVPEIDPPAVEETDLPAVEKLTCSDTSPETSNNKSETPCSSGTSKDTAATAEHPAEGSGT